MKRLCELMIICFLVTSCGVAHKKSPLSPQRQIYYTNLSAYPLFLSKQILHCGNQGKSWETFLLPIHLFMSGSPQSQTKNFEGFLHKNLIRNSDRKVIEVSHYGEEFEYRYENNNFKYLTHSKALDVDLCPDILEYERNTVESAALNASYFINLAHRKFFEATGKEIPPIVLKIAPSIKQTVIRGEETQTLFLTDNAFYHPVSKSITFLPHGLESRMAGQQLNYWEIPMVPAHEYGHHIFDHLFGALSDTGIHLCFDNPTVKSFIGNGMGPRMVRLSDVMLALNEGFADLIAYYTLDEEEHRLTGVKCMERSREANEAEFFNGTPKIFSEEALSSFFSTRNNPPAKSCEDVDYQDVHVIGAIFAHNADRFLTLLNASERKKMQILQEWVQNLKVQHPKLSSLGPQEYFEEVFQLFLRLSLKKFDKRFDRTICDEVNRSYPGLMNKIVECF